MISNKTAAILLLITLVMKADASSFPSDVQELGSSVKSVLNKKRGRTSRGRITVPILKDATNKVNPVEVQEGSSAERSFSQEQPVSQVNEFEDLIKQGRYDDIIKLGSKRKLKVGEFLKRLSPVVKTLEQYKGFVKYFEQHKLVAKFYLYGDVGVIKAALIESRVYEGYVGYAGYADGGDLETALLLAFKEDHHDRAVQLLNVRQEISAEEDEKDKQSGHRTSFGNFVDRLLFNLAPVKDDMPLRNFLASCGEELRKKHPDILDVFREELTFHLNCRADEPKTKKLITDLIGCPHVLTHVTFAKGFLRDAPDTSRSNFIGYAWDEAIREGLTSGYKYDREELWQTMTKVRPNDFIGGYPSTPRALAAVIRQFPTKQKLEEDWHREKVTILFDEIKSHESILHILPNDLWSIIFKYVISLTFTEDLAVIEPKKETLGEWRDQQRSVEEIDPQILARLWNLQEFLKTGLMKMWRGFFSET